MANTLFARNTALTGTAMLLGEPNIANNIGLRHVTISGPAPMTVTATNSVGSVSTAMRVGVVVAQPAPNTPVYLPLVRR